MKYFLVVCSLLVAHSLTFGQTLLTPQYDPALAVVKIRSHGASAVVIHSVKGRSYILGCAHMFANPGDERKLIKIEGPKQPYAPRQLCYARLIAVDRDADLSLMVLDNGPFFHLPVAPVGHRPSSSAWSVGYDEMQWPPVKARCTVLGSAGRTTYTRERPWHGRSGGLLAEEGTNYCIGVVQGYESPKWYRPNKQAWRMLGPQYKGMYVSHAQIVRFLAGKVPGVDRAQPQLPGGT